MDDELFALVGDSIGSTIYDAPIGPTNEEDYSNVIGTNTSFGQGVIASASVGTPSPTNISMDPAYQTVIGKAIAGATSGAIKNTPPIVGASAGVPFGATTKARPVSTFTGTANVSIAEMAMIVGLVILGGYAVVKL